MRTERDDPANAHFTQADSIVPGAGNPAAWNRYAYTLYNPLRYTDPSGHMTCDENGICYIDGWDDLYLLEQDGNTCAVVSIAGALSILYKESYTQADVQPLFRCTYWGIGVMPKRQAIKLNNRRKFLSIRAEYSQGSVEDLYENLLNDIATVVTFALPVEKVEDEFKFTGAGHSILLIGYRVIDVDGKDDLEFIFFNPSSGKVEYERDLASTWSKAWYGCEMTFKELWEHGNIFVSSNAMVSIWLNRPVQIIPGGGPDWKYRELR